MGLLTQNESKNYLGRDGLSSLEEGIIDINLIKIPTKKEAFAKCSVPDTYISDELYKNLIDTTLNDFKRNYERNVQDLYKTDSEIYQNFYGTIISTACNLGISNKDRLSKSQQSSGWSMPTWGYGAIAVGVLLFGWMIFRKK